MCEITGTTTGIKYDPRLSSLFEAQNMANPPRPLSPQAALPANVVMSPNGETYYCMPDGKWVLFGGVPATRLEPGASSSGRATRALNSITGPEPPQFAPPRQPPTHQPNQPVDPALAPLPPQDNHEVVEIIGHLPVQVVAGARRATQPASVDRKGKNKARNIDVEGPAKRGRRGGVANYREEEVSRLLDFAEAFLPTGAKGWAAVGAQLRAWARQTGYPERTNKSIEAKYKQLVRTTKPTGSGECPPNIERAHQIEDMINNKIGSRELDDEDIVDDVERTPQASDEEDEENDEQDDPSPPAKRPSVIKRELSMPLDVRSARVAQRRARQPAGAGLAILSKISASLEPGTQAALASERSAASFQGFQFIALNQQLRDSQSEINSLHQQLAEAQRRADRAEQQLEFTRMLSEASQGRTRMFGALPHTPSRTRRSRSRSRSTPRRRYEVHYRDGGRHSFWGYPEDAPQLTSPPLSYRETPDTPSRGRDRGRTYHHHSADRHPPEASPSHRRQPDVDLTITPHYRARADLNISLNHPYAVPSRTPSPVAPSYEREHSTAEM
ncbi:hypothetical protein NM688_g8387 [Phlebia brevispora]|uniref:Uncharacterized protein n=1 Tax=Phlebia brevispora TaxID=194682 RepID=A0ACC1RTP1_9APHY|nr:hypothetical protein NM688_g8387 [Phlebia brevispora]